MYKILICYIVVLSQDYCQKLDAVDLIFYLYPLFSLVSNSFIKCISCTTVWQASLPSSMTT